LQTIKLPTSIELRPIGDLLPFTRNSRTHSEAQVAQVGHRSWSSGSSTRSVGPTGDYSGHARVLAARKLGMAEVPVIVLDTCRRRSRRPW